MYIFLTRVFLLLRKYMSIFLKYDVNISTADSSFPCVSVIIKYFNLKKCVYFILTHSLKQLYADKCQFCGSKVVKVKEGNLL